MLLRNTCFVFSFVFSLLSLKIHAQLPAYVPTLGLSGYWLFSGNANDESGNGNNGTVNGAQLTSNRFSAPNQAYSFNGSSDFISTLFPGISGSAARAVSFWAKTTQSTTAMPAVSWGGTVQGSRFNCMFNYTTTGASIDVSGAAITYDTPVPVSDDQWHHYVYQFSNPALNQVQIYQDGVLLTQISYTFNPLTVLNTSTGLNVEFGRLLNTPVSSYFSGSLDDIGIWNRVLSPCEIQQLYLGTPSIITTVGSPTAVCLGSQTILYANGANTYTWMPGSVVSSSILVSPSVATTYTVSGTTTLGCSASATLELAVNPTPTLVVSPSPPVLCLGKQTTLTVSGATSYSWTGLGAGASVVVTPTNPLSSYTVVGTTGPCVVTSIIFYNVPISPVLTITSSSSTLCAGASVVLSASGASGYTWQPGNFSGPSVTVSPSSSTIYTVTGANTSGCSTSTVKSITVNQTGSISAVANPSVICPSASSTLQAIGASNYTWFPGNLSGSQVTVNPLNTTQYTVVADDSGCQLNAVVNVSVGLEANITALGSLCSNSVITLFASPQVLGYNYNWSGPGIVGAANTTSIAANSAGIYSVIITNVLNNCTGTASFVVNSGLNSIPLSVVPSSSFACFPGPAVNILASASANLNWLPAAEVSPNTGPLVTVSPSVTTSYTVLAQLGSCTGSAVVTISVNNTPTLSLTASSQTLCAGRVISFIADGADTFFWSPSQQSGFSFTASPNVTTTYTLTGTNGNCSSSLTATAEVFPNPNLEIVASSSSICIGSSATLTAQSDGEAFWLMLNNPTFPTVVVNPTVTTQYTALASNSLGCSSQGTFNLEVINSPSVNIVSSNTNICAGQTLTLTANGASNYTWSSGGQGGATLVQSPISSVIYTVIGGDPLCSTATLAIVVNTCVSSSFGITSAAGVPELQGPEVYRVQFTVTALNSSSDDFSDVLLNSNLQTTFSYPVNYTVITTPKVISKNSSLVTNPFYNGNTNISLTDPSGSSLPSQKRDTLVFTVLIQPAGFKGRVLNSVYGTAVNPFSLVLSDSSNNGFIVDANNDGDPTNDNEPTPIDITPADFFIPEGFSPDGDGINDLFVVKGLNGRKARIIIYNRWGNKVFGTEGTQISWDGKSSVAAWGSDRLPAATYYYTFELLETKNKVLTGFVVLQY